MGHLSTFSAQIKTILQALQLSGSTAFVEVLEYPTNEFSGMPAALITPAPAPSEILTVAQNLRSYGFAIDMFVGVDQEANWDTPFTTMRDLVDAVLDALDKSNDLNGTADILQAAPLDEWLPVEAG